MRSSQSEQHSLSGKWTVGAVLLLTVVGLALRFHDLGDQSLWIDEVYSHRVASHPMSEIMSERPINKPPLDYWMQHIAMRVLGDSEAQQRALAAVAGSLTPLVLFGLVSALFGRSAGLAAMVALVFSPLHLRYSQDARPYALLLLLITVVAWSLVELQRRDGPSKRLWIIYAIAVFAAAWTHYLSLLWVALLQLWLWGDWVVRRRSDAGHRSFHLALWSGLISLAALVSLAPTWLSYGESPGADYPFTISLAILAKTVGVFLFGASHQSAPVSVGLIGAVLAAVGLWWGWRRNDRGALLLVILFAGMWGVCIALYWSIDRWIAVRYLTPGMIPIAALLGMGAVSVSEWIAKGLPDRWGSPQKRSTSVLLIGLVVFGLAASVWMIRNPYLKEDWRGLVTWVGERQQPVIVVDRLHVPPMEHYSERLGVSLQIETHRDLESLQQRLVEQSDCAVILPAGLTTGPVYEWMMTLSEPSLQFSHFQIWEPGSTD